MNLEIEFNELFYDDSNKINGLSFTLKFGVVEKTYEVDISEFSEGNNLFQRMIDKWNSHIFEDTSDPELLISVDGFTIFYKNSDVIKFLVLCCDKSPFESTRITVNILYEDIFLKRLKSAVEDSEEFINPGTKEKKRNESYVKNYVELLSQIKDDDHLSLPEIIEKYSGKIKEIYPDMDDSLIRLLFRWKKQKDEHRYEPFKLWTGGSNASKSVFVDLDGNNNHFNIPYFWCCFWVYPKTTPKVWHGEMIDPRSKTVDLIRKTLGEFASDEIKTDVKIDV